MKKSDKPQGHKNGNGATSIATVQLQCNNPYSIPTFESFIFEAHKMFEVEKDAKNRAYSFILSCGLYNEFSEFCKKSAGRDQYVDCIDLLRLLTTDDH